ncbi:MAG TPA: response regulator [Anaerovoracaceae bacterium]|nr:response regulator [Anaerovoracaceae bacterium]
MANELLSKTKIVYIDDTPTIRSIVDSVLSACGFYVVCTESKERVIQEAARDTRLVIVDMIWPAMENMELCMDLMRSGYTGKVLIVSTRNLPVDEWDVFDGLGYKLMMKPFGPRELLRNVQAVLVESE